MKQNIRKDNKGSTLLLTMVAIAFISILGVLIMSVTAINIQMKQVDYQSKKNFYKTETPMDEVRASLAVKSSEWIKKAYKDTMFEYDTIQRDPGKTLKGNFDMSYATSMIDELTNHAVAYNKADTDYVYNADVLKGLLPAGHKTNLLNDDTYPNEMIVKYLDETAKDRGEIEAIVLKGVEVSYTQNGYMNKIKTDISFDIPDLSLDGSNLASPYLSYALIGDKEVKATGSSVKATIHGDVYGGIYKEGAKTAGGVSALSGARLDIVGENLITRGDISVENGSSLNIGNAGRTMDIWARNIQTIRNLSSSESDAQMNIYGNCNVEDDLILNAKKSNVAINGTYNGFSFGKDNIDIEPDNRKEQLNSQYSSAVLVNGKESFLDLQGLSSMNVAGRAFISRQQEKDAVASQNDIMLGETVSVKSDQSMYLVDNEYISFGHNPLTQNDLDTVTDFNAIVDIPDSMKEYLNDTNPITTYYYLVDGAGLKICYLYYNFKDQKKANKFFKDTYGDGGKAEIDKKSKVYFGEHKGILLPNEDKIDVSAYALQFKNNDSKHKGTIVADPDHRSEPDQNACILSAMKYKSKELQLKDTVSGVNSDNYRFDSADKADDTMFDYILSKDDNGTPSDKSDDTNQIEYEVTTDPVKYGFNEISPGIWEKAIPIDFKEDHTTDCYARFIYNPTREVSLTSLTGLKKGIIIATGGIKVNADFEGLIISQDKISINAVNVEVTSNATLLSRLFSYAVKKEHSGDWAGKSKMCFTHYFNAYKNAADHAGMDSMDVLDTISYANWSKE